MRIRAAAASAAVLLVAFVLPVFAAMSDSSAMKKAILLYGGNVVIGTVRGSLSTNWDKFIGIRTLGCDSTFKSIGQGYNSWEAAFDSVAANESSLIRMGDPVSMRFSVSFWSPRSYQWVLDGFPASAKVLLLDAPVTQEPIAVAISGAGPGVHNVCVVLEDSAGAAKASQPFLFRIP